MVAASAAFRLDVAHAADPGDATEALGATRQKLSSVGVDLAATGTFDLLGNPTGGKARGATLEGGAELSLQADLSRSLGLQGMSAKVDGYGVFGQGLSAHDIDNIDLVSSIEALRSAWLYDLWIQQATPDGRISLRLGQLGADTEFLVTTYGAWFVNTAFGWPALPAVDLPSGGPAYPLATPGVRLEIKPTDKLDLLMAVFNGDPAGPGLDNPQRRDPNGTLFRAGDGAFAIAEAQYSAAGPGGPATLKAGAWYHDKARANTFFATKGLTSVPLPASSVAQRDASLYGIVDAMLIPGSDGKGGLAGFARASFAPFRVSDVGLELATGLVEEDPFGRDGDKAGIGVTTIRVGRPLGSDGVLAARYALRGYETAIEASYQMQVTPHLTLQPDAQYIAHPGGGIPDPARPGREIGSAAVFGARMQVTF